MSETSSKGDSAKAHLQALNAAQWLARLAASYGSNGGDIQLRWDQASRRIMTPEVAPGVAVGLSLPTLALQFDERGRLTPHPIDVNGKSSTELEAWILVELLHRGIDREAFSKALPYQVKGLMSGEEPKYTPEEVADDLAEIDDALATAAEILLIVRGRLCRSVNGGGNGSNTTSDLIVWPQCMEIGFFADGPREPADARIRVGFAAGDGEDGAPRFFVGQGEDYVTEMPASQVESRNMPDCEVADHLAEAAEALRSRHTS